PLGGWSVDGEGRELSVAVVGRRARRAGRAFGMDPCDPRPVAGSAAVAGHGSRDDDEPMSTQTEGPPAVEVRHVSKWYGHVIGVNNLSLRLAPGVTGLLGPNGAGKSTLLQLATGQLRPSQGEVRVLGHRPWNNAALNRLIGLCPEQDAFFEWMT